MHRTPEQIEDEMLVLRVQSGDRAALGELFTRWDTRLVRHAARLAGPDLAPEVAQNAWVGVVRGVGSLRDPARFGPWAYRLVSNKAADAIRRATRDRRARARVGAPLDDSVNRADDRGDSEMHAVRRAIQALPDLHRLMLTLHYVEGMTTTEIGHALGVPAGTVKSRLFHARRMVREKMEDEHEQA